MVHVRGLMETLDLDEVPPDLVGDQPPELLDAAALLVAHQALVECRRVVGPFVLALYGPPQEIGQVELAQDSVEIVARRAGAVCVDPAELLNRASRKGPQGSFVVLSEGMEEGLETA